MRQFRLTWCLLLLPVLFACSAAVEQIKLSGETMGTTYNVTAVGGHLDESDLNEQIEKELERINDQMSTWRDDSEVSRFNRDRSGDWFEVSEDFMLVLGAAAKINMQTGGAFDITIAGLVKLWGFGAAERKLEKPEPGAIHEELSHAGHGKFEIDAAMGAIRKLDPEVELDLSGIAKGYAVDAVAEVLLQSGFEDFIVEIGGEIRASGRRPDGSPWRVAIETPEPGHRSIQTTLSLHNAAIATSGDYREFFEVGGKRYSHIIDPATGSPPDNGIASVSVITGDAMTADALATGLMVMGKEQALALAATDNLVIMLVERNGDEFRVVSSDGFDAFRPD